ncbi:MAG: PorT family protein [Bacteroidaceae bacterium]|nr:PorT family protein [Bacteroidaceae bacterium]
MKKTFFMMMFAFLSVATWAQQKKGTWSVQPKVGLNIAGIATYEHETDVDGEGGVRLAPVFALEAEYQLAPKFALVGGVQYSMQGDSEKGKFYRTKLRMTNKIDYINIPVLAKIGIARNLALKVGLQPSFNIRHDFELNGSNTVYHNDGDLSKIGIDIKPFDLALPVGIAYEFNHHGSACLVAEARWNIGMLKIAEVESGDPYNMVWQLTLGYRFTFGNSIK